MDLGMNDWGGDHEIWDRKGQLAIAETAPDLKSGDLRSHLSVAKGFLLLLQTQRSLLASEVVRLNCVQVII